VISVLAWTMISLDSGSERPPPPRGEHTIAQGLDDVAAFDERRRVDALHGPAVVLGDDHVLRHVDQPAREVARVRRLERGVASPFARRGRGEVLEHGEALAEVGGDRGLDDLAGGLGHEAAHAGELPDLLLAAPRAESPSCRSD